MLDDTVMPRAGSVQAAGHSLIRPAPFMSSRQWFCFSDGDPTREEDGRSLYRTPVGRATRSLWASGVKIGEVLE